MNTLSPTSYLKRLDASVDDEYERHILHRAASVAQYYHLWFLLLSLAITPWVIPDHAVVAVLLMLLPMTLAGAISQRWLRTYNPRPRMVHSTVLEVFGRVALLCIMLWGIARTEFSGEISGVISLIGFAVVFGILTLTVSPRLTRRAREREADNLAKSGQD